MAESDYTAAAEVIKSFAVNCVFAFVCVFVCLCVLCVMCLVKCYCWWLCCDILYNYNLHVF